MKNCKIALCQNRPSENRPETMGRIASMVATAASLGASIVVLPEMFCVPYDLKLLRKAVEGFQETLDAVCGLAAQHNVYLCAGTIATPSERGVLNAAHLIDPAGKVIHTQAKCHLYDVNFKDLRIRESAVFVAGDSTGVIRTELGCIGIVVCYDIRFPEMARSLALQGAELLIVPAVFSTMTGAAHWHLFMRTRAVENQVYLAAVSQARNDSISYRAFGHSMMVNPWGDIAGEAGEGEEILYADIDPAMLEITRARLPLLSHYRSDITLSGTINLSRGSPMNPVPAGITITEEEK
jgi:omega-amidase